MFYLSIPVDGHLVCFYFDIVNNAAMKIHTYTFVWTYISFLGCILKVELLRHMVTICLTL